MGAVPVFRELTEADKARHFGKLDKGSRPVTLPAPPPLTKIDAKTAAENVTAGVLGSMLKDRESFAYLVQMLRTVHGARVNWMTDEQIAQLARETYREKIREATQKAYMKKRAGELVAHIGGLV